MSERSKRVCPIEALQAFAAAVLERRDFWLLCTVVLVCNLGKSMGFVEILLSHRLLQTQSLGGNSLGYLVVNLGLTLSALLFNSVWQWLFALTARDYLEKTQATLTATMHGERPALYAIVRLSFILSYISVAVMIVKFMVFMSLSSAIDVSSVSLRCISWGVGESCRIILNLAGAAAMADLCSRRISRLS